MGEGGIDNGRENSSRSFYVIDYCHNQVSTGKGAHMKPMLLTDYRDIESSVKFPLDCQRKFDGFRCTTNGDGRLWSRNGNEFHLPHISRILPEGVCFDGELVCGSFSTLQSKMVQHSTDIQFHVFDIPSDKPWSERRKTLEEYRDYGGPLHVTETVSMKNSKAVWEEYTATVKMGGEGIVLRDPKAPYDFGKRSRAIMKLRIAE